MRILVQRVTQASVSVNNREIGRIGRGFLLLVGMGEEDVADGGAALAPMADKVLGLRVMSDAEGKMNLSLRDVGGEILAISQFTLHADCRRGRRPSFSRAAAGPIASELFDKFINILRQSGLRVETGEFGAMMQVSLINDGPVTIWLDSNEVIAK
ncbi:D-tyrosyl-tRNA(Tyr) deacylase [bacterium]|nr:D-tyrosyl-tRNA(Tyr) deacylase [bacterium]